MSKICMIVRAMPEHRMGGLEFHTLDLVNALAAMGHSLTIVTSAHPSGARTSVLPNGVRTVYLESGRPGDYSRQFFKRSAATVQSLDASERFDVVHVQEFAGIFLPELRPPVVWTVHGTLFSETCLDRRYFRHLPMAAKLQSLWRFKHRLALHPFFYRSLSKPAAIIVDSDYTRRELLRMRPELRARIHLVPLGVDPGRYTPTDGRAQNAKLTLAAIGRLQKMKGTDVLIEAARLLQSRGVSFRLRIAGKGDYEQQLTRDISRFGLSGCVDYAGYVPQAQLSAFLSDADLFVFPDLTQPAFGLVAVEAMLHGLPVVAARSGAIPEVVTPETGWLYNPWQAGELAGIIQRISTDRTGIAAKSAAARARAALFTAASMAEGVEQVYGAIPRS